LVEIDQSRRLEAEHPVDGFSTFLGVMKALGIKLTPRAA
jgi:hypothetical protein